MIGINIPMPQDCADCPLSRDYICELLQKSVQWELHERREDCPLIDISRKDAEWTKTRNP